MTLAETSAPASGGEHLISHSLDMMAALDGCGHDLHGRQVGVASVLSAELWRRVLEVESPQLVDPPAGVDESFWGPLADVVAGHYAEKAARLAQAKEPIARGDTWDRLRRELSPMPWPPERLRDCLVAAGAACMAGDIRCDRPRLVSAFLHAHEIRSRFTVLDLAYLLGVLPRAASEIVAAWA
jgi:glycerol-1-phosphate dehydrogenase [NAD(P)+]